MKMNRNETVFLVIVGSILLLTSGAFGIRDRLNLQLGPDRESGGVFSGLFDTILNVIVPDGETEVGESEVGESEPPPPPPPEDDGEDKRLPTGMFLQANPNDLWWGDWFYGSITSDGYNYAITIKATHLGSGKWEEIPGFIGPDGMFESSPSQMKTPGYWTFVATAENGVVSNIETLTVRGVTTNVSPTTMSQTIPRPLIFEVYSTANRQNAFVFANNPAEGWSKDIINIQTNQYGYVSFEFEPSGPGWVRGDYETDAIVGGLNAHDYDTSWFTIGR